MIADKSFPLEIFESGGKYYLWERMGDIVDELVSRDPHEITSVLSRAYAKELEKAPHTFLPLVSIDYFHSFE